ncbi:MAG: type II toxin-antitoxin system VapC family toxin [Chloroflexota bacterium]
MALTVVDAGVVIAIPDAADAHHGSAVRALREALGSGEILVLPASAYSELLVAPFRHNGQSVAVVDAFVDSIPAAVQPITREIARAAAQLRAQHGSRLRLPDALVIATALELSADRLLTTDRRWPHVGISVAAV